MSSVNAFLKFVGNSFENKEHDYSDNSESDQTPPSTPLLSPYVPEDNERRFTFNQHRNLSITSPPPCNTPVDATTPCSTIHHDEKHTSYLEPEQPSTKSSNEETDDFLTEKDLLAFCDAVGNLEDRVINTFKEEVENDSGRAFRSGPSNYTISKARNNLAILYKRLARTIRKLGFDEHAIVVPREVRNKAWTTGHSFYPVGKEDWQVGDLIFNTSSGTWKNN